jgi:hypothetical protein
MNFYPFVAFAGIMLGLFLLLVRWLQPPIRLRPSDIHGGVSGLGGYYHAGQPTKLRNILMIVLGACFLFPEALEEERVQYHAFEKEVSWIREVAPNAGIPGSAQQTAMLSSVLVEPFWIANFPDLIDRMGDNSSIFSDRNEHSVASFLRLLMVLIMILLLTIVSVLVQAALTSSNVRGAVIVFPALYIITVSIVLYSIIVTVLNMSSIVAL